MNRRTRTLLFKLHAWLGLHVFIVLTMIFLTGALLIFVYQIEALFVSGERLETSRPVEERASFGARFDQILAHDPDVRVLTIERGPSPWIADKALVDRGQGEEVFLWFSAPDGGVGGQTGQIGLRRVLFDLHASFMTGHRYGELLVTTFAFVLAVFIVTGLITYRRFWRGFFRRPSRAQGARGWWAGLHRLCGVWLFPFLIVISLTGMYYAVSLVGLVKGAPLVLSDAAARDTALPAGFDGAALDAALAVAQAAAPDTVFEIVRFPGRPADGLYFTGTGSAILTGTENSRVVVDPLSRAVMGVAQARDLGPIDRLSAANDLLHEGHWGGLVSRFLWLAFGLAGTVLCGAGAMIYAARSIRPDQPGPGGLRRIWAGMSPLKWALPLFFLAMMALAIIRYV